MRFRGDLWVCGPRSTRPRAGPRAYGRKYIGFGIILRAMFQMYPKRTVLGLTLMASQAFLYNAIFFTYALVLTNFYGIEASGVPYYLLPFALGNILGPLLLGRLFDTVGRVPMIAGCYFVCGALMTLTGYLFYINVLNEATQHRDHLIALSP